MLYVVLIFSIIRPIHRDYNYISVPVSGAARLSGARGQCVLLAPSTVKKPRRAKNGAPLPVLMSKTGRFLFILLN